MNDSILQDNGDPFQGIKLQFPVTFDLKVIMEVAIHKNGSRKYLESILEKCQVPHSGWSEKFSSAGKYISYSVKITLQSQLIMDKLYSLLKEEPAVKFAV